MDMFEWSAVVFVVALEGSELDGLVGGGAG